MPERNHHPLVAKTAASLSSLAVTPDSKLLVAVSGGPDSLALAHVLQSLRGTGAFAELDVAHVDHGIRKEAADEENAVRRYCADWGVPIHVKRVETLREANQAKRGVEETARNERYLFFEELTKLHGVHFVLTAHTANDQAETVLMHLVRGAGVHGLAGIPARRKLGSALLIRPWLDITRNEILEYIREFDLHPSYDASNNELSYQRNRVRHIVLPAIAHAWPDRPAVRMLAGLAHRMRELDQFLEGIITRRLAELHRGDGLEIEGLRRLEGFELHSVLEAWIAEQVGPCSISSRETARIAAWLTSASSVFDLRGGIRLRKDKAVLALEKNRDSLYFQPALLLPGGSATTPYGEFHLRISSPSPIPSDPFTAVFDREGMGNDRIRIRPWRAQDRIAPFGMGGRRKLVSDLLTEAKVRGERRRNYPVVELEGAILWIPGIRRSDIAPVTDRSRDVVEFIFRPRQSAAQ